MNRSSIGSRDGVREAELGGPESGNAANGTGAEGRDCREMGYTIKTLARENAISRQGDVGSRGSQERLSRRRGAQAVRVVP